MEKITKDAATEIARIHVERLAAAAGDRFELLLGETKDVDQGWLFYFNSADFVRTRNPIDSLAGNGPLLVLQNGQIHELPSALPWQEALSRISSR